MFTLPTLTAPVFSEASSSISGAIMRQGPHQGAQKSTNTGVDDSRTSLRKFSSVNSGSFDIFALLEQFGVTPAFESAAGGGRRQAIRHQPTRLAKLAARLA